MFIRRALSKLHRLITVIYRSLYFPPTVICAAIIVASLFGWQAAKQSLAHDLRTAEQTHVATAEKTIYTHIVSYEQILRGGVGLFQGSDQVTSQDWKNYLSAFNVKNKYPGVQALGYAKVVTNDELSDLQDFMATQNVPDFQIKPAEPQRDTYAAVIFLQTVAAKSPPSYGFDMYSEASRRTAMYEARDTNHTTITPRIQLMTNNGKNRPTGFNMYAPYYGPEEPTGVDERRAKIRGYVYASFRTSVFFEDVISELGSNALGFQVFVKGDGKPLYTSPSFDKIDRGHEHSNVTHTFSVYGQTWRITYALDHTQIVSKVQLKRPGGVLFFGTFTAILISLIIYLVLRGRARDLQTQKERAVELAKDELLSLASHQLRTPATGVKQYVGMVLQGFAGDISDEQESLLEKAYASNDRQLRIINEILHLAKIDAGRIVLARQSSDLNELVRDIVNEQQPDIKASEHKVQLHLPQKPTVAGVDTHMLRMAIENLLSNAIKYTKPGGRIVVGVRKYHGQAYITVQDNGVGIDNSDIEKIFHQFSRLPNEMSQRVEGTGIGLYLARHLVELHKGQIQVVSQPGKGSTFTIVLPLRPTLRAKGL